MEKICNFEVMFCNNEEAVKCHIKGCEGKHIQQVAYSSYHDALTQVCFNCKKIRTSMKEVKYNCGFCKDTKYLKITELDGTVTDGRCPQCDDYKLKENAPQNKDVPK